MESKTMTPWNEDPDSGRLANEQLRAVEQARAMVYTRYPPLGRWYPVLAGGWAAGFVASYTAPTWLSIMLLFGLLAVGGAGIRWYIAKRGVMPNLRGAPPAIKREMTVFFVGYAVVIAVVAAVYLLVDWWVASILAFTMFTALVAVYEKRYAGAASRDVAALGIDPVAGGPA